MRVVSRETEPCAGPCLRCRGDGEVAPEMRRLVLQGPDGPHVFFDKGLPQPCPVCWGTGVGSAWLPSARFELAGALVRTVSDGEVIEEHVDAVVFNYLEDFVSMPAASTALADALRSE